MAAQNQLLIDLIVNDKEALSKLKSSLQGVETQSRATTEGINFGFLKAGAAVAGALIIFDKLVDTMKVAINEAAESERVFSRLSFALKLQGDATGAVARAYADMATEMASVTRFTDEAIQGVMQRLTTIGLVGPSQMRRVTQATLDLSTALGVDLEQASNLVAKAAIGETSALSRYGIIVSENIEKTQRFEEVLRLIETRMGKAAQEDVNSFSGAQENLGKAWKEMLEEMGKVVTESPKVREGMNNMAEAVNNITTRIRELRQEDPNALFGSLALAITQNIGALVTGGPGALGLLAGKTMAQHLLGTPEENARDVQKNVETVGQASAKLVQQKAAMAEVEKNIDKAKNQAMFASAKERFKTEIQIAQASADLINAVAAFSGKTSIKMAAIVVQAIVTAITIMMDNINPILKILRIVTTAISAAAAISQLKQAEAALEASRSERIAVPGFARGVENFGGGLAVVGERGPELVNLPRGSDVIPNGRSFGNTEINITINNPIITTEEATRGVARQIASHVSEFLDNERERL